MLEDLCGPAPPDVVSCTAERQHMMVKICCKIHTTRPEVGKIVKKSYPLDLPAWPRASCSCPDSPCSNLGELRQSACRNLRTWLSLETFYLKGRAPARKNGDEMAWVALVWNVSRYLPWEKHVLVAFVLCHIHKNSEKLASRPKCQLCARDMRDSTCCMKIRRLLWMHVCPFGLW